MVPPPPPRLAVAILIALLVVHASPAQAYVDPGGGSLALQVLMGGAAGLAVLIRLGWRHIIRRLRPNHLPQPPSANQP